MKDQAINAFLGKDTSLEGKLNFNGTVRIDGHFKGEITSPEGNLIAGEAGIINANIRISHIFISGRYEATSLLTTGLIYTRQERFLEIFRLPLCQYTKVLFLKGMFGCPGQRRRMEIK